MKTLYYCIKCEKEIISKWVNAEIYENAKNDEFIEKCPHCKHLNVLKITLETL